MAETPTKSPAPPVSYPEFPSSYSELIFAAIEAIDEKNGANKSSISNQIEATYGVLPAAHSTLLSHHLNKMKASGELIVVKNKYVKPDPNGPPKRGRGRPAKPKEPLPEGSVVSPPRPRGRPPKPRDTQAPGSSPEKSVQSPVKSMQPPPEGTVASPPRPRGRPPKVAQSPAVTAVSTPRPRGRPPKQQDPLDPVSSAKKPAQSVSGRKRGRPSKSGKTSSAALPSPSGERRGRGRPPKLKTPAAAPVEA